MPPRAPAPSNIDQRHIIRFRRDAEPHGQPGEGKDADGVSDAPAFGGPDGLLPVWWALSLGACLGGNGTIIVASANLTVAGLAERAGIRFAFVEYIKVAYPMMLITVALSMIYLEVRYL